MIRLWTVRSDYELCRVVERSELQSSERMLAQPAVSCLARYALFCFCADVDSLSLLLELF